MNKRHAQSQYFDRLSFRRPGALLYVELWHSSPVFLTLTLLYECCCRTGKFLMECLCCTMVHLLLVFRCRSSGSDNTRNQVVMHVVTGHQSFHVVQKIWSTIIHFSGLFPGLLSLFAVHESWLRNEVGPDLKLFFQPLQTNETKDPLNFTFS